MRISQGSLAKLKKTGTSQIYPTTCYLMIGSRCKNNCLFCAQSVSEDKLSRISWLKVDNEIITEINNSYFKRVCLQCTSTGISEVISIAKKINKPLSISYNFKNIKEVDTVAKFADNICISLDVVNKTLFRKYKNNGFEERLKLIKTSVKKYKNISTHIIVGLGETKAEMINIIKKLHFWNVTIGLFAFTPIEKSVLQNHPRPDIRYYRTIQAFYYKLKTGNIRPEAFQTSGCMDCNRPYYNEQASGPIYNYPRKLSEAEYKTCIEQIIPENEMETD